MSECVVRMGIPVNCDKCDLRNGCKLYVDYSWSLSDCFPTRPKPNPLDRGCLIICSLPEGHGTLIDLETAAERLSERYNSCHMTCGAVMQFLDGLPIIVPAERK